MTFFLLLLLFAAVFFLNILWVGQLVKIFYGIFLGYELNSDTPPHHPQIFLSAHPWSCVGTGKIILYLGVSHSLSLLPHTVYSDIKQLKLISTNAVFSPPFVRILGVVGRLRGFCRLLRKTIDLYTRPALLHERKKPLTFMYSILYYSPTFTTDFSLIIYLHSR